MTWLEIMDMLDRMPRHLLKRDAELWHYDDKGNYEVLPVDDVVTPLTDGGSDEDWGPDGNYRLSLQSFDVDHKPEPKETFIIDITTLLGQSFSIEAEDTEDARHKASLLLNNRKFFDEFIHAKWLYDNEWDGAEIDQVVDGYDCHGDDGFIATEVVDSYLEEE